MICRLKINKLQLVEEHLTTAFSFLPINISLLNQTYKIESQIRNNNFDNV